MLTVHSIASGSEGNSLLVSAGGTHILVDAGISARRITAALSSLGLTPGDIAGVLVTHEHSDHTAGLATLTKQYRLPLYASGGTAGALCARIPHAADVLHLLPRQGVLTLGDAQVTVFPTSHDAAESIDFRFDCGGAALGVLTDTGCVTPETEQALQGVDLLVLESNHDEDWLLSGPYPYYLKQRILSEYGHLSNDAAAEFAIECVRAGTSDILLAHLSDENNSPELAEYTVGRALQSSGLSVRLATAPRDTISEVHVCRRSPSFASEN